MSLNDEVQYALEELKPRLDELADGYAELIEADEENGILKLRLIGGRLH